MHSSRLQCRRERHVSPAWIAPLVACILTAAVPTGHAQPAPDVARNYPGRPVRILVGFAPGGGADITARLMAQKFGDAWGQAAVVENKPGAGGNIATEMVAKARPDGLTMIMVTSGHAISVSLYEKLAYDPVKDVAPISPVASTPSIVTAHPSAPYGSVREMLAYAKANPGRITYGSPGTGTTAHLAMVLLAMMTETQITHVPYNGSGASQVAALGGQIQLLASSLPSVMQHVRSGKLKTIGVTSLQRTQLAADLPSIAEGGVPGYDAITWYGMLTAPGTPAPIVTKINQELGRAVQQKDVLDKYQSLGFEPMYSSPAQFTDFIKAEIGKWARAVKESGAKPD